MFLAHGRDDEILPFSGSQQLRDDLVSKGFTVDWYPFDGGHTLTPEMLLASREFLMATGTDR